MSKSEQIHFLRNSILNQTGKGYKKVLESNSGKKNKNHDFVGGRVVRPFNPRRLVASTLSITVITYRNEIFVKFITG